MASASLAARTAAAQALRDLLNVDPLIPNPLVSLRAGGVERLSFAIELEPLAVDGFAVQTGIATASPANSGVIDTGFIFARSTAFFGLFSVGGIGSGADLELLITDPQSSTAMTAFAVGFGE